MNRREQTLHAPIIPDFEKSEVISWHIQDVLLSREKADENAAHEVLEMKKLSAIDAESKLLNKLRVVDFFCLEHNEVFCSGLAAVSSINTDNSYTDSFMSWNAYFRKLGVVNLFMNWLSYRWIVPTMSYYRWASGYEYKRSSKLTSAPSDEVEKICTNSMSGDIDDFWGDKLNTLSLIEKKSFNILLDLGITQDTKELIRALPSSTLDLFNEALHRTLTQELALNPNIFFKPRYGFRLGDSAFYWSGVGRIPAIMKEKIDAVDDSIAWAHSDLMKVWRLRNEISTTIHTEHFVELPSCVN